MSHRRNPALRTIISAGSAIGIVVAGLVGAAPPASAATTLYVGLTAGTGGSCAQPDYDSIQSAVTNASTGDTIHICTGAYTLGSTVVVDKSLAFVGSGQSSTTISGGDAIRMFDLVAGATSVSFSGLTLWNGRPAAGNGGAIRANVAGLTVSVTDCRFTANTKAPGGGAIFAVSDVNVTNTTFDTNGGPETQFGGAIYSLGGAVTIIGSSFLSNDAGASGGGAGAVIGAAITADSSTFTGNTTTDSGGALLAGTVVVMRSTFANNSTSKLGQGGAIWANGAEITTSTFTGNDALSGGAVGASGPITIGQSTFSGNGHLNSFGGGARSVGAVIQAWNSTFTGNQGKFGAGLMADTMALVSDTFVGNQLHAEGAGSSALAGTMSATNTIFADSFGWNCQITPTTSGGNLSTDDTCVGTLTTLAKLKIQPLADNGGPTQTMALAPGSTAIDAGIDAPCTGVPDMGVDQRGAARPFGAACDSGAFEVGPVPTEDAVVLPPPWYQALGRLSATSPCPDGYLPSWAEWPNQGRGGFTCEKTTFWSTQMNGWVTKPGFVTRSLHRHPK